MSRLRTGPGAEKEQPSSFRSAREARRGIWRLLPARLARWLALVRVRTTVAAVLVVGAALAVGASGMFLLLDRSLVGSLEASTTSQSEATAVLAATGDLPTRIPAGGPSLVQVVSTDGRVLASTPESVGIGPFLPPLAPDATSPIRRVRSLGGSEEGEGPWLVARRVATLHGEAITVEVATSLDTLNEVLLRLGVALSLGVGLLVALVGATAWFLAGRALRPVEAIRAEVADISGRDLHRRVPEPPVVDEIGRLAETMNDMLDRLESAAARQRRFVADASHELRTPLSVIQAQLEVLSAHPDGRWPEVVAEVLSETQRLSRLVEDLLSLARSDRPEAHRAWANVDLDELVLAEVRWLRAQPGLAVDASGVSAGRVRGDPDQLRRVIRNLCDNAARHATGRIRLELRSVAAVGPAWAPRPSGTTALAGAPASPAAGAVELVVSDDGPGIPTEDRLRVFDRFVRLDEARNRLQGGSGLGLAIVAEIIAIHGGEVWVEDASWGGVARGAAFHARFPLVAEHEPVGGLSSRSVAQASLSNVAPGRG